MTGRELIIYILLNNLEEVDVFEDGCFIGFINEYQAAVKFGVGVETVRLWYKLQMLKGYQFGNLLYFPATITDPREGLKKYE